MRSFDTKPFHGGARFPDGSFAAFLTAFEHRVCDYPAMLSLSYCSAASPATPLTTAFAANSWWTGKDSNLRSPQGAADLQSAGFSHSPTRPRNSDDTNCMSKFYEPSCLRERVARKHKTDSCPKTPALLCYHAGNRSASLPYRNLVELAEGFEPPTL